MSLQDLDTEQLFEFLLPLDETSITAFCQSNRMYVEICRDKYFWKLKYTRDYGVTPLYTLIAEFPDVYPENWHLAYHYRTLTNRYQHIWLAQQYTPKDILDRYHEGVFKLYEITPSSLQQLGLWDETAWRGNFAREFSTEFGHDPTEQDYLDQLDLMESDNHRIGDKHSNLILHRLIGDTTTLVGFSDRLNEEMWFNDDVDQPEITANTIVTPRIIEIKINNFDARLEQFAITRRGMAPGDLPESIYTYTSLDKGFTLRGLVDNIIDAVTEYATFAHLAIPAIPNNLQRWGINDIIYENGVYLPQLRTW